MIFPQTPAASITREAYDLLLGAFLLLRRCMMPMYDMARWLPQTQKPSCHMFHMFTCSPSAGHVLVRLPSVDKGRHGFDGQKCAHTASSPLAIRQVFPAGLFLSGHISAPAKLLRTCQRWIFQGFLVFETQAGACPPRRKGQKSPKRRGDRRVCPC